MSKATGSVTKDLALYTTVYPAAHPFLAAWYGSVLEQSDQDFDLWIGVDKMSSDDVRAAVGQEFPASWVIACDGDTPASIRDRALDRISQRYGAVVLVDSDDLLHPSRVAAARSALETSDLTACALRLVDEAGLDLDLQLGLPRGKQPEDVLPRHNVFGFSNTAFRSSLLRRCLPIPADAVLVDWFLATRAWLMGARLTFDSAVRMDYRQHGANTARVRPPFAEQQLIEDTRLVRDHFRISVSHPPEGTLPDRLATVQRVARDVDAFHENVVEHPTRLEQYVTALNGLEPLPVWWSCVAHPALSYFWTLEKEQR